MGEWRGKGLEQASLQLPEQDEQEQLLKADSVHLSQLKFCDLCWKLEFDHDGSTVFKPQKLASSWAFSLSLSCSIFLESQHTTARKPVSNSGEKGKMYLCLLSFYCFWEGSYVGSTGDEF